MPTEPEHTGTPVSQKHRLELHLNSKDAATLKELTKSLGGATQAGAVRRAIRTLSYLNEQVSKGYDIVLVKKDDPQDTTKVQFLSSSSSEDVTATRKGEIFDL